jgi:hypothetical protein
MKIEYPSEPIVKSEGIIIQFGNARLIKRADGKHELVGGCEGDFTQAKEWVSLSPMKLCSPGI